MADSTSRAAERRVREAAPAFFLIAALLSCRADTNVRITFLNESGAQLYLRAACTDALVPHPSVRPTCREEAVDLPSGSRLAIRLRPERASNLIMSYVAPPGTAPSVPRHRTNIFWYRSEQVLAPELPLIVRIGTDYRPQYSFGPAI
jgi:hypothetical protein